VGGAEEDALTVTKDLLAEDMLVVDVLMVDVYTPEAPKIAPGPYSGVSMSNVGVRP
jgi:hypothetical protein